MNLWLLLSPTSLRSTGLVCVLFGRCFYIEGDTLFSIIAGSSWSVLLDVFSRMRQLQQFIVIASWNRTAVDLTQKKKNKQPKCTCRVYHRLNRASSSAFLISQGSNHFSFQIILHWCVLSSTFMLLCSAFYFFSVPSFIHLFCIMSWIWCVGSTSLLWRSSKLVIRRIWTRFAFLSDFSYNLYSFLILKDEQKIIKLLLLTLNMSACSMSLEDLMSHGNTFNESSSLTSYFSCLRLLNTLI